MPDYDRLLAMYRARVDDYHGVDDEFGQRWRNWCRALLTHGGDLVVPPMTPEPDLDILLAEASPQPAPTAELALGGDCHANVAQVWIDATFPAIGTGYALTDVLWRQHSWAIDEHGHLHETKWRHHRYIGISLPAGEPTVLFVLNNYRGDVKDMLANGTERASEIIRVLRASRARLANNGAPPP